MSAEDEIIDLTPLLPVEQNSRMYKNLLEALAMLENRPSTYDQVDEMLHSLFGRYTGAKTTCVYWRAILQKEGLKETCEDPKCDEPSVHRICSCKVFRKTRGIWLKKKIAKHVFKSLGTDNVVKPCA